MPFVPIGELARILKRDPKAIRVAVEKGLITRREDGLFDLEPTLQQWRESLAHEKGHNNRSANVTPISDPDVIEELSKAGDPPEVEEPAGLPDARAARGSDYARAKAATQIFDAQLKRLRYQERAKLLVPAAQIEDAAFRSFRCLRDACMNIPSRLAAQLASESDIERCYQILEKEIDTIFNSFAEGKIA